jgi:hypothetical protein
MAQEQKVNVSAAMRIVTLAVTSTATPIRKLIANEGVTLPDGLPLQIILRQGSADVTITDGHTADTLTLASDTEMRLPSLDAIDLLLSTATTASIRVIVFIQKGVD